MSPIEDLKGDELDEFMRGYRAASTGEPHWPHNTPQWLDGYAFYVGSRADAEDAKCTAH